MTAATETVAACACLPGQVCAACRARGYVSGLAGYAARIYPRLVTAEEEATESGAVYVCRACRYDEWDGVSSYPWNPAYGECAHCNERAELISGCCGDCWSRGYRETCARAHGRQS